MSFGGSPSPPAPPKPPKITDPAIERAKLAEREMLRRRRGFMSTILTGGQGVMGQAQTQAPQLKQLLGG
jgi:hypothetical protein